MTDLPPMEPCPVRRNGRHALASIVPMEDASLDVTLFCEACGSARRFPVSGPILVARLDDEAADEILRAAGIKP